MRVPTKSDLPSFESYFKPTVECVKARGGSMTIEEMEEAVAAAMGLTDELRAVPHGDGPRSQFDYELAWVRTYLKKVGAMENSERGVWRLTPAGAATGEAELAAFLAGSVRRIGRSGWNGTQRLRLKRQRTLSRSTGKTRYSRLCSESPLMPSSACVSAYCASRASPRWKSPVDQAMEALTEQVFFASTCSPSMCCSNPNASKVRSVLL